MFVTHFINSTRR